jgi:hypothetical protein
VGGFAGVEYQQEVRTTMDMNDMVDRCLNMMDSMMGMQRIAMTWTRMHAT